MINPVEKLFELWMAQNHPYYFSIVGTINILLFVAFIISIVLPFFSVIWWWKLSLLSTGLFAVVFLINRGIIEGFIDDFKSGKNKVKL